jgi:hypothetical protein
MDNEGKPDFKNIKPKKAFLLCGDTNIENGNHPNDFHDTTIIGSPTN